MSTNTLYVSPTTGESWEIVVGLEVHAQLATRTKLFCACANDFGGEPNTRVCELCTGQPGALPAPNANALRLAVRAALALEGQVAPWSKFDRKNYFYCDLPKGYQISQFDRPYCTGAVVELASGKRVGLERMHLEEDAGKATHDARHGTLVDLNRAGVPLVESVSLPELSNGAEAAEFLAVMREHFRWVGASDGDMEKGSMRADVNVSVRKPGEALRTKVELKNLNSFRHVEDAVDFEVARQVAAYEGGDPSAYPVQETRLWDPERAETRSMRSKEDAQDYRYFPEPDLPPLVVPAEMLAEERERLPELPRARRARWKEQHALSDYELGVLSADRALADYFDATAAACDAREASKWIQNEVLRALADPELPAARADELLLTPAALADVLTRLSAKAIPRKGAQKLVQRLLEAGGEVDALVRELGLDQTVDDSELEAWCAAALEGQDAIVADVRAGKEKALGALMGPVMKASRGQADPQAVRAKLLELIQREAP